MCDWGMKKYLINESLMEEFCKLNDKQQYKVCYAFYDEIFKYPQFDENTHCLKFDEIYESINLDWIN